MHWHRYVCTCVCKCTREYNFLAYCFLVSLFVQIGMPNGHLGVYWHWYWHWVELNGCLLEPPTAVKICFSCFEIQRLRTTISSLHLYTTCTHTGCYVIIIMRISRNYLGEYFSLNDQHRMNIEGAFWSHVFYSTYFMGDYVVHFKA